MPTCPKCGRSYESPKTTRVENRIVVACPHCAAEQKSPATGEEDTVDETGPTLFGQARSEGDPPKKKSPKGKR